MVQFVSQRRRRKPLDRSKAPQNSLVNGRCVAVFGPPRCGTTLALKILNEETKSKTSLITEPTHEAILAARKQDSKVIFIDGFPQNVEHVQQLFDERWVTNIEGAVIRLVADRGFVIRRGKIEAEDLEAFHEGWARYESSLGMIEERIRRLSMPYFCVNIEDLETALGDLARRSGIRS